MIEDKFREIIARNEGSKPLEFSDPDGSGRSGWSFGACQFDCSNNDLAIACLRDCGFTEAEIKGIRSQTIDVAPLNKRLSAHADVIAGYDDRQLAYCLRGARQFVAKYDVPLADDTALLSLADTINQYGSLGPGTAARLLALARPVTAADILEIKLTWEYGKAHPDDVKRRHNNIMEVMA